MLIEGKKLIKLSVYTKSGKLLGRVDNLEIDIDEQLIINYCVKSQSVIKNFFTDTLLIHRSQIVSITADKITVDDSVLDSIKEKEIVSKIAKEEATSPTVNLADK
ncbi:MAG: PRC-barrel domain-containing protein [Patescibacteria group bacterium]